MIAFIGAGLDPSEFWKLTPKEIGLWIQGAGIRIKREQKERAWLAWTTANLGRAERMPRLETLFQKEPKKERSWEEKFVAVQAWATVHNEQLRLKEGRQLNG